MHKKKIRRIKLAVEKKLLFPVSLILTDVFPGMTKLNPVPIVIVTNAPIAFHQNQKIFGKKSHIIRLVKTPATKPILAAFGFIPLPMIANKNIASIGP